MREQAGISSFAILGIAAGAWVLESRAPDLYLRLVQEDEIVEWATFYAFVLACALFAWAGFRRDRAPAAFPFPWWQLGLAAFCLFVAMEEISWGQRLVGYRPPTYFLEHNYQQELNLHNVVAQDLRMWALKAVILGYGVLLAALGLVPALHGWMTRLGVTPPHPGLLPGFLATFALYQAYPLEYSGEWVEAMLGIGFLGAALAASPSPSGAARRVGLTAGALLCIAVLGSAQAAWSRSQRSQHPESVAAAQSELEALRRDFLTLRPRTPCGLHKRVYGFAQQREVEGLYEGAFAALTAQGLPEARAHFYLDPWNSPYWLRDSCGEEGQSQRRRIVVYSPGPNRMRESTAWSRGGDDLDAVLYERPGPPVGGERKRGAPAPAEAPSS